MLLIFDNYDSFTYNLCDYFKQLSQELLVIRNDEMSPEETEGLNFSGIVISPGPGIPETSGILMELIDRWHQRVPILGICLGHQALGTYFGAQLIKAPYPMHGKVSAIKINEHEMWNDLPAEIEVCRYDSLVLAYGVNQNALPELIRGDTNQGDTEDTNQDDRIDSWGHESRRQNGLPELIRGDTNQGDELIREDTNQGSPILITATSKDDNTIMAFAHRELPIWGIQFSPGSHLTQYGIQILNNWLKAFILHK